MRICIAALLALLAGHAVANPVPVEVPSGQPVSLMEILLDETPGELWARFRFLAPDLRKGDAAIADMEHLCQSVALPYTAHHALDPKRIVISFSDRQVAFGEKAPEATQFFEIYRPDNGACIWEAF